MTHVLLCKLLACQRHPLLHASCIYYWHGLPLHHIQSIELVQWTRYLTSRCVALHAYDNQQSCLPAGPAARIAAGFEQGLQGNTCDVNNSLAW